MSERTALLLMDFQRAVVEGYGEAGRTAVAQAAHAREGATRLGIPVIHVVVRFRAGHPEIADSNRTFAGVREAGRHVETDPSSGIVDMLEPGPAEPVVVKRRVGAFSSSDLDAILRALDARHLVLAGIATSGVVLSTLRLAADLDFRLTVLRDACADRDADVHTMLIERVFPRQADVVTTADWLAGLRMPDQGAARQL